MTTHYLTAGCPFGNDEIEVEIGFGFTPVTPERGPSYASGGEPADPPEVEFLSAKCSGLIDADMRRKLDAWAREYLASDAGQQAAIDALPEDDDGDYRRDRARDDAMMRD